MEAAGERWDRHVVGYDLGQQMQLLSNVRKSLRGRGGSGEWLREHNRAVLISGGMVAVLGLGFFWWRRRRRSRPGDKGDEAGLNLAHARIVKLYQRMEEILRRHGITRSVGTPPLAHARALKEVGFPFADEVLELTLTYQAVRFGHIELTELEYANLAARVDGLRESVQKAA
jgi:hypothetical protein